MPAMKLDRRTSQTLRRIGDEFLLAALRCEVDRRDNLGALFELGAVLTRLRRYKEGLEIDRRLVALEPSEPILRYNLACSFALLGDADRSLDELSRAIDLGYKDAEHMVRDRDLRSLHRDARFEGLVKRIGSLAPGER
jgi:tetratricopeptide (TPR) repeat protein